MEFNVCEENLIYNERLPFEWQSQVSLDELDNFLEENWKQRFALYNDKKVETRQQFIKFEGHKNIKTNNYIGTIVFKGHQLNIFPKVFMRSKYDQDIIGLTVDHMMHNIVHWLEYCSKIDFPYINIKSELDNVNNLKELFETLYVHYVEDALHRGLFYRYEEKEEDCTFIKSKMNIVDYFTKKIPNGNLDKFKCNFSNFEFDNMLNRIIKYVCRQLFPNVSNENKKIIRRIFTKLNEVSDVRCCYADCDNIKLNRLHKNYNIILSMSKMFLLNKTTNYNMNDIDSFCFLFPTELLFEGFIGGFIKECLDDDYSVKTQAKGVPLFNKFMVGDECKGTLFNTRYDIIVRNKKKGSFILDTKYKHVSRFDNNENIMTDVAQDITQSDLYQILSYAEGEDINDVYLLYPLYKEEDIDRMDVKGVRTIKINGVEKDINVHILRIPFVFEDNEEKLISNLKDIIDKIFIN